MYQEVHKQLFYSLFHWYGCVIHYSCFSKHKYSLFIFYLIPLLIIYYSASTPELIGVETAVH